MEATRRREADEWLNKAENALLAAGVLAGAGGAMVPSLLYNAQQAAERALKAFLTARGAEAKGRNLQALLDHCATMDPAFADFDPARLDPPETALPAARKLLETVRGHMA